MRLLLTGPHRLLRAALRLWLENHKGVSVVGEAATPGQAQELCAKLKPDAALLDFCNGQTTGLDAVEQIHRRHPAAALLVLSARMEPAYVRQALLNGARGYLAKSAAPTEMELALEAMQQGESYVSPGISQALIGRRTQPRRDQRGVLSERQRQVLRQIANGYSTREIARRIGISVKTVETHRARMMETLRVRGSHGLLRYALQHGLAAPATD